MNTKTSQPADLLESVRARYAKGATAVVPELCCPVDYDAGLLAVLPQEIIDRDYGCGDPSKFVRKGDVVLDLGSGAGKICYMASQIAGAEGRVIGVDATDEMLTLARQHRVSIGERIGWQNVEFRNGFIQDLALDRDQLAKWIEAHPVRSLEDIERLRAEENRLRLESPMIPDGSVDLVMSNCVLNLVDNRDKNTLFSEIHRVLRRGGRCAISDIVSDEEVPTHLQNNPELWSGCISGAIREDLFLQAFEDAGLYGVEIVGRQEEPWAVVEGIEFRSLTVVARKGLEGPCWEHNEAVIYGGPWKQVEDDDGHVLRRGERTAVCRKTYSILTGEPYGAQVTGVQPLMPIAPEAAEPFDCRSDSVRSASETKLGVARDDKAPGTSFCCDPADSADSTDSNSSCC